MVERRIPITLEEALQRIQKHVPSLTTETVSLSEATGRYLAEDLVADHPVPMFDRSMYDGYAIRAEDTYSKPTTDDSKDREGSNSSETQLKVIDSVPAGKVSAHVVRTGEAVRIMTGAPLPQGADAVIMLEDVRETEHEGEHEGEHESQLTIAVQRHLHPGDNVSKIGEDTAEGTVLARAGRRIGAGEKALLATFGYDHIRVSTEPAVGIFATGSELLPVDAPMERGKIRNSNSPMLEAQVRRLGAMPCPFGILEDDFDRCYEALVQVLDEVDYVITTGGAAVGDFDFVQRLLHKVDADVLFNKVAMRPGSVTTVARVGKKWIFGLSGNPAACYIGFEFFARPVLKAALGAEQWHLPRTKAVVDRDIPSRNPFTRFLRAQLRLDNATVKARTVGLDKSGVVSALIDANALIVVPAGSEGYQAGEEAEVILLDEPVDTFVSGSELCTSNYTI